MKRILVIVSLLVTIGACSQIKESVELIYNINKSLNDNFNQGKVNTSFSWGSEEGDNHLIVTFYDFPLENNPDSDFEKMAIQVTDFLYEGFPELEKMEYMEIRFTDESNLETANSFFIYRVEKNGAVKQEGNSVEL